MRRPSILVLLAALQLAGAVARPAAAQTGAIRGVVRSAGGDAAVPLPFAMVQIVDVAAARAVLTDDAGGYLIGDVPPGMHRLRALSIGHAASELEVLVPAGGVIAVDLALAPQPIALAPLAVTAGRIRLGDVDPIHPRAAPPAWDAGEVALRTLEAGTGMVESGLTRAAGEEGGGNDPADPRDALLMRGSTTDLKLVLLDGAPVYTPFHLAGLLPSFDASTLGGAALHVGGAPARYDGGLSYILDLRTRPAARDRLHGGGSVDLLSARASLEGPIGGRAGLMVAGRALHDGAAALWGGERSPYGYREGLARFDAEPADGHRIGATAFANEESVSLGFDTPTLAGPSSASWGNRAASLFYQGSAAGTLLDASVGGSRYEAELPIPASTEDRTAGRTEPTLARGVMERRRLTLDATRPLGSRGDGVLRLGASADFTDASYDARRLGIGFVPPSAAATSSGSVVGAYLDATVRASGSVLVRGGLRADRFSSDGRLRLAPRVSVLWSLSDAALLTLAGGRYHQYGRATDTEVASAVDDLAHGLAADPAGAAGPLPVATADHLVLGLDQRVRPGVRLGIQGFVKGFSSYGALARSTSSGVDLRVLAEGGSLTGWVGYSLAWFWSDDRRPGASTSEFTGRHLMSAGLTGRLAGPLGMDLRVAFSEGLPYTSIHLDASALPTSSTEQGFRGEAETGAPALGGGPADGFLRVDAELHADFFPEWRGRRFAVRPYAKVLNALDRRDGLFWYFSPWRDPEARPLAQLALVPLVGFEWRF